MNWSDFFSNLNYVQVWHCLNKLMLRAALPSARMHMTDQSQLRQQTINKQWSINLTDGTLAMTQWSVSLLVSYMIMSKTDASFCIGCWDCRCCCLHLHCVDTLIFQSDVACNISTKSTYTSNATRIHRKSDLSMSQQIVRHAISERLSDKTFITRLQIKRVAVSMKG